MTILTRLLTLSSSNLTSDYLASPRTINGVTPPLLQIMGAMFTTLPPKIVSVFHILHETVRDGQGGHIFISVLDIIF